MALKKRKPSAAFMKPMQPDAALGAIVGTKALPRTQVSRKIWAYVKRNKLQSKQKSRLIKADVKLRSVVGGKKQVTMFEMAKLVYKHLK